jgi:hypothetical protein
MTPFQKQVLLKEEQRQAEEADPDHGTNSQSPSGALNARSPGNQGYSESYSYENAQEFETENQAEFIE